LSAQDILQAYDLVSQIYVDDRLVHYILDIVFATRDPKRCGLEGLATMIAAGASPRASIAILQASKAYAFLQGRHFVIPDDVKYVAPAILRHRIMLTYQASANNMTADAIIKSIIDSLIVP
jgi:MoxR-like ATPase